MTDRRYPTAVEREAAKRAGADSHPSDRLNDPIGAVLTDQLDNGSQKRARLKHLGGSDDDAFNIALAEATRQTAWFTDAKGQQTSLAFTGKALAAIAPQDELEGMLAAQMVACHHAAMECARRAMIAEQPLEMRAMNLSAASKASRTYAMLLEALDRHRGKGGEQRVVVEHLHKHVHVHNDHSKIVDADPQGGGGDETKIGAQPHAARLTHAPSESTALWGQDPQREPVPIASDAERKMPHARRSKPRRASRAG